ncbi:hypothetical protein V7127_25495 [Bacillus sp. JJ1773]
MINSMGAVGPVTNSVAYYAAIPVSFTNLEEIHNFSKEFSIFDSSNGKRN